MKPIVKHKWSLPYLQRRHGAGAGVSSWRNQKRRWFENKTGVRWASWHEHDQIVFYPTWQDAPELEYPATAEVIIKALTGLGHGEFTSFLKLWVLLPHLPLRMIIGVAKWMTKQQRLVPTIGRVGSAMAVRLVRS